MKLRAYIMMLLFGLGFLLSSLESHPCSDISTNQISQPHFPDDHVLIAGSSETPKDESHDMEFCHFGHCSHARPPSIDETISPALGQVTRHESFYHAGVLSGEERLNLRPPAKA